MNKPFNLCALAFTAAMAASVQAQEEKPSLVHPEVPVYSGWGWHIGVEHLAIDSEVAKKEKIRDSATRLTLKPITIWLINHWSYI